MTSPSSMWRQGWRAGIDGGIPSGKFCDNSDFMAGYNVGVSQRKAADLRCFMLYVKPTEFMEETAECVGSPIVEEGKKTT